METFEQSWPEGFHDTIPRKVVTVSVGRKVKVGDAKVLTLRQCMLELCHYRQGHVA